MWVASLHYVQAFPAERREFRLRRNRPNQRVWGSAPHSRDSALLGAKRHKRVQGAKGVLGGKQEFSPCPWLPTAATDKLPYKLHFTKTKHAKAAASATAPAQLLFIKYR